MQTCFKTALLAAAFIMTSDAIAQGGFIRDTPIAGIAPAAPIFSMDAMNVYRRFDAKLTPAMVEFYQKALGLKPLQPIQLSSTEQMIIFGIGKAQIKLAAGLKKGRQYFTGPVHEAVGIRLFTLTYPDSNVLNAQFKAAGLAAPNLKDLGGGRRGALVKDPSGFTLQLIVDPKAAPTGVDVGINTSDLERSRAFYRDFVELKELPPVQDKLLGVTRYPFRNGETTISLWSKGKNLPADTGSAGVQYVIGNVDAVNARAMERKVTVEEPLGGLPNFSIRFVWLNDPDGVTNYFAQVGGNPVRPAPLQAQ